MSATAAAAVGTPGPTPGIITTAASTPTPRPRPVNGKTRTKLLVGTHWGHSASVGFTLAEMLVAKDNLRGKL